MCVFSIIPNDWGLYDCCLSLMCVVFVHREWHVGKSCSKLIYAALVKFSFNVCGLHI